MPYSSRVDSLTNFDHSWSSGDELFIDPLVEDAQSLCDTDLEEIRKTGLDATEIAGRLVSHDGRIGGVAVNFILPEGSNQGVSEATSHLNALLDRSRSNYPAIDYYLTGQVVLGDTLAAATEEDLRILAPLMFAIISIVAAILLKSVLSTAAIVVVIMFAVSSTVGFAGWNGAVFSGVNSGIPLIVTVIAVASSIHLIATVLSGLRRGLDRGAAVVESIRKNAMPVFLTSVTTAIGFLSLNFSDSPPFHDLGNYVAFGVMFAFIYTMTLLPALLFDSTVSRASDQRRPAGLFRPVWLLSLWCAANISSGSFAWRRLF